MKTRKNIKKIGGVSVGEEYINKLSKRRRSKGKKSNSAPSQAHSAPTPKKVSIKSMPSAKRLMEPLLSLKTRKRFDRKKSKSKVDEGLRNVPPPPSAVDSAWRVVPTPTTLSPRTYKLKPEDVMVVNDSDDIHKLKSEINRLNNLNENLIHQIYNLTEKIKELENVTGKVQLCAASSSEQVEEFEVNKELNKTLNKLKDRVLRDIMTKINDKPELKTQLIDELYGVKSSKEISSFSPRITSALQKKAAEKLPRLILSFVSSKIGQKVTLACSKTDDYLSDTEIDAIVTYIIKKLESNADI